ncbi:uncharacterized protein [Rutidosis leptorrhynchoides]|uniref:uncharacterized protein n=1 Tax=Rutidosis leptorrhynchoides TaxID=125765 RepID=UPI003A9A0F5D
MDRIVESNDAAVRRLNWDWSRVLTGRLIQQVVELSDICTSIVMDVSKVDSWSWSLSASGCFSVRELTGIIEDHVLPSVNMNQESLRNRLVPKKLEVFVWRAIKKRLPVRCELDKRGIDLHSLRCPLCDDELESVDHSLIFCKHALDVWDRIYSWCGLGNFSNLSIGEILRGNSPCNMSCIGKMVWQAIEWVGAYYIWKNRNNKVFRDKNWTAPVTLSEIQLKSFEWISNRMRGRKLDWLTWLTNPSSYFSL